jgi:hypothetical protein
MTMQFLLQPVGAGAVNLPEDVAAVAELLGLAGHPPWTDALAGFDQDLACVRLDALAAAVRTFQQRAMASRRPDGRVDPGGLTEAVLVAQARRGIWLGERKTAQRGNAAVTAALAGSLPAITLAVDRPDLVSPRTIAVLELLGHCCDLPAMKVTEGIRTYERMAIYFLDGTTSGGKGVRGQSWTAAKKILDDHNKGKAWAKGEVPQAHVDALAATMRALVAAAGGKVRVSNHVVDEEQYAKLNVLDLGYNSNPLLKERNRARVFAHLLDSFHVKNSRAEHKFVQQYHPPHHLNAVLDTNLLGVELPVENAWHVELVVTAIPGGV